MHRVLLTDELQEVLDDLTRVLGDHFEVYSCKPGPHLTQVLEHFRPELMVLDLSAPGYDPLGVLKTINHKNIQVIATCYGTTDHLVQLLDEIGVRWLIVKPLQAVTLAARMLELELELDDVSDKAMRSAIYTVLLQAGIFLGSPAFRPLTESILFAVQNPSCSMTDQLYPHVARICNTTTTAIDIAMRRGIELAFRCRTPYNWRRLFDSTAAEKCPSNSSFIKQLAHTVRKQLHLPTY